jgi:hypothetical protein
MNYYIYLHIKLETGEPFYIGKGKDKRCYSKQNRSNHWNNIVNKNGYDIILIEEGLTDKEAMQREIYWIKRIGRNDLGFGPLCNFTNGGEGSSGRPMNDKTKAIIIKCNKNRLPNIKQKEAVGNIYKGKFGKEHNRSMAVLCVETGIKYGSQSEASRKLGLGNGSVSWSIKNKRPIRGMHFEKSE